MRLIAFFATLWCLGLNLASAEDFEQRVRGLLSNRCFACHGPDEEERQGGFRLDLRDSFLAEADSGEVPVVPGKPEASELLRRIKTSEEWERMPPPSFAPALTAEETRLIEKWIHQGAQLPEHWSFVAPVRPPLPEVELPAAPGWQNHPVDRFVLQQQLEHGLRPSSPATRAELLRRVSLDLTGLPPTPEEVAKFEANTAPDAYLQEVDRLLASPAYGEHWARKWLDLARYADSAGYADDPSRTIWAYRDWVVRALNANMPVDEFTVCQLAGDLLDQPTEDDLIATAFHRNTLTNNEGGTNDEEFRNVAIVDRVNTTMAVWMGVTMACAQCHTHKYDPFTQDEYFQLFAIFNQSADADRRDESPTLELFTQAQRQQQRDWQRRAAELTEAIDTPDEAVTAEFETWARQIGEPEWTSQIPLRFASEAGLTAQLDATGSVLVTPPTNPVPDTDTYKLTFAIEPDSEAWTGLQLQTLPAENLPNAGAGFGGGNFVLSDVSARLVPSQAQPVLGKRVRIELPGKQKILSLAEVQVFSQGQNIAAQGQAKQSSTAYGGDARRAIDGNTSGEFDRDASTTHTETSANPWWEVEFEQDQSIDSVVVWNRTDNKLQSRLNGARLKILDAAGKVLFTRQIENAPQASETIAVQPHQPIELSFAAADYAQSNFAPSAAIDGDLQSGWAVGGSAQTPHQLTLIPRQPIRVTEPTELVLELRFQSPHKAHLLASFQLLSTTHKLASDWARLTGSLRQICFKAPESRTSDEQAKLAEFFRRQLANSTRSLRAELEGIEKQLVALKPATSVPIMRDLPSESQRETFVQIRGNYKAQGQQVTAGTPEIFHPLPRTATHQSAESNPAVPNRLDLAHWLVDRNNPLTARVWTNRIWESLFGIGIVRSSEEFGAQGDPPSHPALLDWLAVELMDSGWDQKRLLRLLVTSQTYQQTSRVEAEELAQDQDNIWLARGPRVRLSAEMVRDQALAVSGLLARKMYGQPVRPPQPDMGLKAAFGSDTDWKASQGEDRYRRGLYTTWRRSNPYPSMATFDAPSREVCTLRRDTTNTPLQALVTLNDPGFVEAAQALARRVVLYSDLNDQEGQLAWAFELATSRKPLPAEVAALQRLLSASRTELQQAPEAAEQLATDPLGPLPPTADAIELAAMTAVCNVLLNLDEVLMKR